LVGTSLFTHISTASEMAIPRDPVFFGSFSRIFFPASVLSDGLGYTFAPNVSMNALRYGLVSIDTLTW
jgi:hypothetical protein